ncbi:MAG TPA: HAD family hydrolase [Geminicoccaceae bacterium]|nr:HAD family hydrolase [Geminicoccus sp.]HMU49321.1 HAD family hydrolase [Geminicoccaceae bacterium]
MTGYSRRFALAALAATAALGTACSTTATSTPQPSTALPSWNDGPARSAVLDFVAAVTNEGGPDYVPAEQRIAVFDNDGTLWVELPVYTQLQFALDRVKALAPEHPEWRTTEPFASVLGGDLGEALAGGEQALVQLVMATHAGNTTEEFSRTVEDWIATARHPKLGRPYTELVYRPMIEVLELLRANGFETWIVSGGGVEFMRPWTEGVYGVPPERVIGSSIVTKYELRGGTPVLVRLPKVDFIDDKAGKPVGIHKFIGRRPIAAFGNSDGDFEMLEWTTSGPGRRLGVIVHHDDAAREFAYDRDSHVGRLARGLDEAAGRRWTVVSMRDDWNTVFAP